ncbi:MAG TPA: SusC/RagA family TonB-linked outer membrane protein, partial [Parapedobacter sp.]|nr:SusC/RagA family TonB-linked outer membrane protein [Parapedobacter sp.]
MNYFIHAHAPGVPKPRFYRMSIERLTHVVLLMKLTTFLILAFSLSVSATATAQKVSLRVDHASMPSVLKALRKQSGYAFVYNPAYLKGTKPVTLDITEKDILEALPLVFAGQPVDYTVNDKVITIVPKPHSISGGRTSEAHLAENPILAYPEVHGRVVDSLGNPLVGASVRVLNAEGKRTTLQTKTDGDGYFLLRNVPDGYQLEISYIGHVGTNVVAAADVGTVVLQSAPSELEEVEVMVNTGYQQLPKERATGSFVQIDNERLNEQIQFNVLDRLPILTSGMVMDRNAKLSSGQMLVRGVGTILGNTTPLVILDNFPYEGDVGNINPDDIESVTVLRDAAAASIWGAKAANGVIVLTSKKAKPNQKISANFSTLTAIQEKPDLFALDLVNSSDMIDVEQMLFENGYHTGIINSVSRPAVSPLVELLIKKGNTTDPEEVGDIEREINRLRKRDVRDDFLRYMYRPGLQSQNTLNLAMGTNRFAWNASAGHGINRNDLGNETNRSNFLVNSRMYISKRLRIDGGFNVSFLRSKSGRPGYGDINAYSNGLFPYAEFADAEGNALPVIMNNRLSYLETLTDPELLDWKYYPLEDYKHNRNTQRSTHVTLTSGLEFDLLKWLKLSVNYQFQTQRGLSENLQTIDSYEARNTVNMYAKRNPQTGELEFPVPKGGMLTSTNDAMQAHNIRGQLAYHWQSNDHEVVGLLGSEVRSHSFQNKSDKLFGYNPENLTHTLIDLTRQHTYFISGGQAFIPSGIALNQRKNNFISTYANGAYTYRQRYAATFSARRDASNLFGLNVNDKWNPFWSVGASWELSKEDFWHSSMVDYLKIRATYGSTGNLDPSKVALTTIRYVGTNPYNQLPYAQVQTYVNPELKWETVSTTNVGIDFSLLRQRIKGSLEGYLKVGKDLYGSTPVDYTGGTDPIIIKNVASMIGRGIDLEMNTMNT